MGRIIGITGTLGAGKGTIVEFLKKKGFKHFQARELLWKEVDKRGLERNRDSLVKVANDLREKHGSSYVATELYKEAEKEEGDCIIESLRNPGEIEELRKHKDFILFAIDADQKIRYERISDRKSVTDNISFEKFIEQEKTEMTSTDPNKQNLSKCIQMADYKFTNNGSFEELYKQVGGVLNEL